MTQLLAEDQPIPDDENAKKPALLKHQSIVLTEDELKELGMTEFITDNVINCEIAEEEEYDGDAGCEGVVENAEEEKDVDPEECNHEDSNDITAETNETDDGDKDKEQEKDDSNGEVEGSKEEDPGNTLDDVGKIEDGTENELNDVQPNGDEGSENTLNENEANAPDETAEPKESDSNENGLEDTTVENPSEEPSTNNVETPIKEEKPKKRPISGHKFKIPAMWTPMNARANAAFVYIYFRNVSLPLMKIMVPGSEVQF